MSLALLLLLPYQKEHHQQCSLMSLSLSYQKVHLPGQSSIAQHHADVLGPASSIAQHCADASRPASSGQSACDSRRPTCDNDCVEGGGGHTPSILSSRDSSDGTQRTTADASSKGRRSGLALIHSHLRKFTLPHINSLSPICSLISLSPALSICSPPYKFTPTCVNSLPHVNSLPLP
jgi:hypothetical protein